MSLGPLVYVYAERKISAFMQDRIGPNRVGPIGLLQTIADTIKLLFKEAIFPKGVDRKLFVLAPLLVNVGAFMPFAGDPVGRPAAAGRPQHRRLLRDRDREPVDGRPDHGRLGLEQQVRALRRDALGRADRLLRDPGGDDPAAAGDARGQPVAAGDHDRRRRAGLQNWFLFRYFPIMPIAFVVFFTAGLAETNRAPFDIPEAESELVAGFHTEYSGFFFSMFFLAEYTEMFVFSAVASVLFLGGYLTPFPNGFLQMLGPVAARLVLDRVQGVGPRLRDDVAALDAAPLARRPADAHRLEGAAADLARPRGGGRRPRAVAAHRATASPGTASPAGC